MLLLNISGKENFFMDEQPNRGEGFPLFTAESKQCVFPPADAAKPAEAC